MKIHIEKLFLYEQLKAYSTTPAYDMKIVFGDFNSKFGKEYFYKGTNDKGLWLISYFIRNACFQNRIHLTTWISPDEATKNQIGDVLCDIRHWKKNPCCQYLLRPLHTYTVHDLVTTQLNTLPITQQIKAEVLKCGKNGSHTVHIWLRQSIYGETTNIIEPLPNKNFYIKEAFRIEMGIFFYSERELL